jgi:hypothetical protein
MRKNVIGEWTELPFEAFHTFRDAQNIIRDIE